MDEDAFTKKDRRLVGALATGSNNLRDYPNIILNLMKSGSQLEDVIVQLAQVQRDVIVLVLTLLIVSRGKPVVYVFTRLPQ